MGTPLDETNGPPPSPGRGGDKRWRLGMGWCFYALRNGEIQLLGRQRSFSVSPCQSTGRWGQGLKLQASNFPSQLTKLDTLMLSPSVS